VLSVRQFVSLIPAQAQLKFCVLTMGLMITQTAMSIITTTMSTSMGKSLRFKRRF
jgi:hypothetical protein